MVLHTYYRILLTNPIPMFQNIAVRTVGIVWPTYKHHCRVLDVVTWHSARLAVSKQH
jgi:hypothetical protein